MQILLTLTDGRLPIGIEWYKSSNQKNRPEDLYQWSIGQYITLNLDKLK